MNNLELLHEGFKNEVDDLNSLVQQSGDYVLKAKLKKFEQQLKNIVSNLEGLCDSLYSEFENSNENEFVELEKRYSILHELLNEKTSDDEKTYIRIKHGIDLEWGGNA
jgi:predicted translin family RNA/ssDNA-binding protein